MKTYTVRITNNTTGKSYCENQFDTYEDAVEFMNSYPASVQKSNTLTIEEVQ